MRKILCGVLAFVICSFSIITYAEDENTTNTTNTANNVTDLQTKQEEIKKQIEDAKWTVARCTRRINGKFTTSSKIR